MIKNKALISRMSLEQKLQLVTSKTLRKSSAVDRYEFPEFKLSENPVSEAGEVYATLFPSDATLAKTWNMALVRNAYRCIGNEAKATTPYAYFNVSNNLARESVSEDYYFSGKFLAAKTRGVNMSGAYVNFEDMPDEDNEQLLRESVYQLTDAILRDNDLNSIFTASEENAETYADKYKFRGLSFGLAYRKEDVARLLSKGCSLIFLQSDFSEELPEYFKDLQEQFNKSLFDYKAHKIKLVEHDRRVRDVEIFDEETLDEACDRLVSALLDMRSLDGDSVDEEPQTIDPSTHLSAFNEFSHDKVALSVARQSAILLKNEDGILPLDPYKKAAVLGDSAKSPAYRASLDGNYSTCQRFAFDVINDYDILTVGYAHGYERGEIGRDDVLDTTLKLCAEADYALVYLWAEKGEKKLPQGQIELLEALNEKGIPVVAVVSADDILDFSFMDLCKAVLYTGRGGQAEATAALDILTGKVSPSGRFTETVPYNVEEFAYQKVPAYSTTDGTGVRFPFGFGLSYTTFEYSNLRITENGVSCFVKNTGAYDSYVTVQLYVQKAGTGSMLAYRTLKGFSKVFAKKGETVKVTIPFDGNTFRSYDPTIGHYIVEGGNYGIFLGENAADIRLAGELTLNGYIFDNEAYERQIVETSAGDIPVEFSKNEKRNAEIRAAKKGVSFGLKLFLTLLITVYYDAVGVALLLTDWVGEKSIPFYIIIGVLLAAGNVFAIIFIFKIAKNRKLQQYEHPNDVITDLIDHVKPFEEMARVVYEYPVDVSAEEFLPQDETPTEEQAPAEVIKTYDNSFGGGEAEEVQFVQQIAMNELCENFHDFAKSKGLTIASPVRELFAAFAASKLVFVDVHGEELLPLFISVLEEYFGCAGKSHVEAQEDWGSPEDLLWRLENDTYVTSDFANAVYAAGNAPEMNAVAMISNVIANNFKSYFRDFVSYALYPSEEHTLMLNEELSLRMPDNITYLVFPSDPEFFENLTPDLVHASVRIEVVLSKSNDAVEPTEPKPVSHRDFLDMVQEVRETNFLSEQYWKKLDEIVAAINTFERFSWGNKNVLQMERFTAVEMSCNGDEMEVFKTAFIAKIVPLLKTLKTYRQEGGDKKICAIVEKVFGEEDISAIKKQLLRSM